MTHWDVSMNISRFPKFSALSQLTQPFSNVLFGCNLKQDWYLLSVIGDAKSSVVLILHGLPTQMVTWQEPRNASSTYPVPSKQLNLVDADTTITFVFCWFANSCHHLQMIFLKEIYLDEWKYFSIWILRIGTLGFLLKLCLELWFFTFTLKFLVKFILLREGALHLELFWFSFDYKNTKLKTVQ